MANGTFHDDEIKAETAKSDANEPDDCRVVSLCRGRRQFSFSSPQKKSFSVFVGNFPALCRAITKWREKQTGAAQGAGRSRKNKRIRGAQVSKNK